MAYLFKRSFNFYEIKDQSEFNNATLSKYCTLDVLAFNVLGCFYLKKSTYEKCVVEKRFYPSLLKA